MSRKVTFVMLRKKTRFPDFDSIPEKFCVELLTIRESECDLRDKSSRLQAYGVLPPSTNMLKLNTEWFKICMTETRCFIKLIKETERWF